MEKLRMGLVGCGGMMTAHLRGIETVEDVEIVACCDLDPAKAKTVSEFLGNNASIHTDYREMADLVDAVLVALPHDLHYECGMFFASRGKHVMMEKPLCNTEEECINLIEKCEEMNVTLMCAYPVRYWAGIRKLKEEFDSGKYGVPMQMSIWTEQLTGADIELGGNQSWELTGRLGGGQLFSHGCHYIDLLLWFLGNPVSGAHFGTRNGTPWMLREGTSALVMKFENGVVAYHGATWGARGSRQCYDFQIMMEKGLLEYDHIPGEVRFYDSLGKHIPGQPVEKSNYKVLWSRGDQYISKETQYEIRHFAECVRTGKKPLTHGRSALQSLRVIWALYNAEKNNMLADLRGMGLNDL